MFIIRNILREKFLRITNKYKNFILYSIIGCTGATLDFLIFALLTKKLSIPPLPSNVLSVSLGITNNFFLNTKFNFKLKDSLKERFLSFYSVGLIGMTLSSLILWILNKMGLEILIAKIITIFFVVIVQFFLNKKTSFSQKPKSFIEMAQEKFSSQKKKENWETIAITIVVFLGITLRFFVASYGGNYDLKSYEIVAKIMTQGKNVYATTNRYNYGPIWAYILFSCQKLSFFLKRPDIFRYLITTVLTVTDLGIFHLLRLKFKTKTATLFFLNPVSIIISGYHSQFGNLAILTALLACSLHESSEIKNKSLKTVISSILLGISLSIKHIFAFFPFWWFFKESKLKNKFLVIAIPFSVFILSFLPFWHLGKEGILNNVFGYESFNNAPFFHLILPTFIKEIISPKHFFYGALLMMGFLNRKKNLFESSLIYSLNLVLFSSAIANQYLAIPTSWISSYLNPFGLLYLGISFWYLLIDSDGLKLTYLADIEFRKQSIFDDRDNAYTLIILCLGLSYLWHILKKKIDKKPQNDQL